MASPESQAKPSPSPASPAASPPPEPPHNFWEGRKWRFKQGCERLVRFLKSVRDWFRKQADAQERRQSWTAFKKGLNVLADWIWLVVRGTAILLFKVLVVVARWLAIAVAWFASVFAAGWKALTRQETKQSLHKMGVAVSATVSSWRKRSGIAWKEVERKRVVKRGGALAVVAWKWLMKAAEWAKNRLATAVKAVLRHVANRVFFLPPGALTKLRKKENAEGVARFFEEVMMCGIRMWSFRKTLGVALWVSAALFSAWWACIRMLPLVAQWTRQAALVAESWQHSLASGIVSIVPEAWAGPSKWFAAVQFPWAIATLGACALFLLAIFPAWLWVKFVLSEPPLVGAVRAYFTQAKIQPPLVYFLREAYGKTCEDVRLDLLRQICTEQDFLDQIATVQLAANVPHPPTPGFELLLSIMVSRMQGKTTVALRRLVLEHIKPQSRGSIINWAGLRSLAMHGMAVVLCCAIFVQGIPALARRSAAPPMQQSEELMAELATFVEEAQQAEQEARVRSNPRPVAMPASTGDALGPSAPAIAPAVLNEPIVLRDDLFKEDREKLEKLYGPFGLTKADEDILGATLVKQALDLSRSDDRDKKEQFARAAIEDAKKLQKERQRLIESAEEKEAEAAQHDFEAQIAKQVQLDVANIEAQLDRMQEATKVLVDEAADAEKKEEARKSLANARAGMEALRNEQLERLEALAKSLIEHAKADDLASEDRAHWQKAAEDAARAGTEAGAGRTVDGEATKKAASSLYSLAAQSQQAVAVKGAAAPATLEALAKALALVGKEGVPDPQKVQAAKEDTKTSIDEQQKKEEEEKKKRDEQRDSANEDRKNEDKKKIQTKKLLLAAAVVLIVPEPMLQIAILYKIFSGKVFGSGGGKGGSSGKGDGKTGDKKGQDNGATSPTEQSKQGPAGQSSAGQPGQTQNGQQQPANNKQGSQGTNSRNGQGSATGAGNGQNKPGEQGKSGDHPTNGMGERGDSKTPGQTKPGDKTPSQATAPLGESIPLPHLGKEGGNVQMRPAAAGGYELVMENDEKEPAKVVAKFSAARGKPDVLALHPRDQGAVFTDQKNELYFASEKGEETAYQVKPGDLGLASAQVLTPSQKSLLKLLALNPRAKLIWKLEMAPGPGCYFFGVPQVREDGEASGNLKLVWLHRGETDALPRSRVVADELATELASTPEAGPKYDLKTCLRRLAEATKLLPQDEQELAYRLPLLERQGGSLRLLYMTEEKGADDRTTGLFKILLLDRTGVMQQVGRLSKDSYRRLFLPNSREPALDPRAKALFAAEAKISGLPEEGKSWFENDWLLAAAQVGGTTHPSVVFVKNTGEDVAVVWTTGSDREEDECWTMDARTYKSTQARLKAAYTVLVKSRPSDYRRPDGDVELPAIKDAGWTAAYEAWTGILPVKPAYPFWEAPRKEEPSLLFQEAQVTK